MTNVIGVVQGESEFVVIVGGHYDTAKLDGFSFVGANDGGSSAAFLLEMARRVNRLQAPSLWEQRCMEVSALENHTVARSDARAWRAARKPTLRNMAENAGPGLAHILSEAFNELWR